MVNHRAVGLLFFGLLSWSAACATTTENPPDPRPTADASAPDVEDTGAPAEAGACSAAAVGRLCVRGAPGSGTSDEALTAGGKVLFQLFPKGCFSSSATTVVEASCNAEDASAGIVKVSGKFCLGSTGNGASTPDCSGGGFANCEGSALPAGKYTAKLGGLEVAFEVPSTLPGGGACVGSL